MTHNALGWGVIATGGIAAKFSEDLHLVEGARSVAVCSRSRDKAQAFADRHGFKSAHDDLAAFLDDPEVEAVYVASPNSAHRQHAMAVISAGKAVLVEKPIAMTGAAVLAVAEAASRKGVFAMEALWTRFLPAIRRAKALIDDGAIGEPVKAEATIGYKRDYAPDSRLFDRALGGGALYDLGVYPLSVAILMLGEAKLEKASWKPAPSGVDIESEMQLSCGGTPVAISVGFTADAENAFLIYGTEGALRIDRHFLRGPSVTLWKRPLDGPPPPESGLAGRILKRLPPIGRSVERFDYPGHGLHFETRSAQAAILSGKTSSDIMPMDESAQVMKIIEAVLLRPPQA